MLWEKRIQVDQVLELYISWNQQNVRQLIAQ